MGGAGTVFRSGFAAGSEVEVVLRDCGEIIDSDECDIGVEGCDEFWVWFCERSVWCQWWRGWSG